MSAAYKLDFICATPPGSPWPQEKTFRGHPSQIQGLETANPICAPPGPSWREATAQQSEQHPCGEDPEF
jgi:hypothetical protein